MKKRNKTCNFEDIKAEELNDLLRKFYAEVKPSEKSKSKTLTPATMTCLRAAVRRHLIEDCQRSIDIINDKEFLLANQMFVARCKLYAAAGNPKPQHKPMIEPGDMKKLGVYFEGYKKNPDILLETVWFYLCYFFGRRGREGWTQMTKGSLQVGPDSEGKLYVHLILTETSKNYQGGYKQKDIDYSDQRMYGEGVDIVQFYLNKVSDKCDRLFQYPLSVYDAEGKWFKNAPVGKNRLGNMMQTISKKAGLSTIYTCHSVRASTITHLYRAGVQPSSIINVTKHKNISSLSHYIDGMSEGEKRHCSGVLSNSLSSSRPSAETQNPGETPAETDAAQAQGRPTQVPEQTIASVTEPDEVYINIYT